MRPLRYIIAYRDRPKAATRYFGPFVDLSIASRFEDALPDPLPGGIKVTRPVQPFSTEDDQDARNAILQEREMAQP